MLSVNEINLLQAQNEGLKKQNADLQKENARLKEEIKEVKKYQYQQEYLDKEIEEMQKALKTLAEGLNKRQMTLQEVKSIVSNIIDGYIRPYGDYEQLKKILDLITKAGSEEE